MMVSAVALKSSNNAWSSFFKKETTDLMLVSASSVVMVSLLGLIGTWCNSKRLLCPYLVAVLVIVITQIVAYCLVSSFDSSLDSAEKQGFDRELYSSAEREVVSYMHKQLEHVYIEATCIMITSAQTPDSASGSASGSAGGSASDVDSAGGTLHIGCESAYWFEDFVNNKCNTNDESKSTSAGYLHTTPTVCIQEYGQDEASEVFCQCRYALVEKVHAMAKPLTILVTVVLLIEFTVICTASYVLCKRKRRKRIERQQSERAATAAENAATNDWNSSRVQSLPSHEDLGGGEEDEEEEFFGEDEPMPDESTTEWKREWHRVMHLAVTNKNMAGSSEEPVGRKGASPDVVATEAAGGQDLQGAGTAGTVQRGEGRGVPQDLVRKISTMQRAGSKRESDALISLAEKLQVDQWDIAPAPEPADAVWQELSSVTPWRQRCFRWVWVELACLLIIIILSTPVAFAAHFKTISDGVSKTVAADTHNTAEAAGKEIDLDHGLGCTAHTSSTTSSLPSFVISLATTVNSVVGTSFGALLFDWLPVVWLSLLNIVLLELLWYSSWGLEPVFHFTAKMRVVLIKAFTYLLLSSLLLPALGLVSVTAFFEQLTDDESAEQFGKEYGGFAAFVRSAEQFVLASSGSFFINFINQMAFVVNGAGLNSLSQKIFLLPWGAARAATVREWREAQAMWPHYFGEGTANLLLPMLLLPISCFTPVLPL
jgi:hypothetical protein